MYNQIKWFENAILPKYKIIGTFIHARELILPDYFPKFPLHFV